MLRRLTTLLRWPWLAPLVAVVATVAGAVVLRQNLVEEDRRAVESRGKKVAIELQSKINDLELLLRKASFAATGHDPSAGEWRATVQNRGVGTGGSPVLALAYVNASLRAAYVEPAAVQGLLARGMEFGKDPALKALADTAAVENRIAALTTGDGTKLLVWAPAYPAAASGSGPGRRASGFVVAVVDAAALARTALEGDEVDAKTLGFDASLVQAEGDKPGVTLFGTAAPEDRMTGAKRNTLGSTHALFGLTWRLELTPREKARPTGASLPWRLFMGAVGLVDLMLLLFARQRVTLQRRAEALAAVQIAPLRKSEAIFRRLFHNAPIGHNYLDPTGYCLSVNAPWSEIVGTPAEQARGNGWRAAFADSEQAQLLDILEASRTTGKRVVATLRLVGATPAWGRFEAQPLTAQGRIEGFIATLENVTEEKRLREAAENRSQLLQALIVNAPVAMAMLDKELKYVVLSHKWRELFGLGQMATAGLRFEEQCPKRFDRFKALQHVALVKGVMLQDSEDGIQDEDGGETFLNWAIHPVISAGGECEGVVTVLQEVTDLVEAKSAALAAARFKADFLANMSHELRTPMGGVFGMTELLLQTVLTKEQREYVAVLESSGRHLLHIINDILDYTKIEVGKLTLENIPFDLAEAVHESLRLFAEQASTKGLELAALIDPRLADEFTGDPARLRQILVNLVGNAVKFTERGEVLVSVGSTAAGLRFEVLDSGAGMPPEVEANLFKPFSQADASTTRRFGGTGLGLAICRQLVQLMGGEIGVTTAPGLGSTFWFVVPLAPAPALNVKVKLKGRALVLGRHPRLAAAIAETLAARGATVTLAANTDEARAAIYGLREGEAFDHLVLDLGPRDADGLAFLEAHGAPADGVRSNVLLVPFGRDSLPAPLARLETQGLVLMKPVRLDLLPAALRRVAADQEDARERALGAPVSELIRIAPRGTVLIVDDNDLNRNYAAKLVGRLGFVTECAAGGAEAVAAVVRREFDLILMDCHMPDVDGYEATRGIRAMGGGRGATPIVAMTASTIPEDRQRCLEAGMNERLIKPVRFEDFRLLLDRVCGSGNARALDVGQTEGDLPVLDEALFGEWLETLADQQPDAIEAILSTLAQVEKNVAVLCAALAVADAKTSADVAHKLAGSAALLGGARVRAVSASIERMARGGDVRAAVRLGAPLSTETAAFAELLRKRIAA